MTDRDREEIERHERDAWYSCPEYQAAVLTFYRRHVCKLDPWPPGWERSLAEAGWDVYNTMNGPTEFTVIGNFKDFDVTDRLGDIRAPTIILGGEDDEARPAHMQDMHERIPGSEITIFPDASHLCFYEQREAFMARVNQFLDQVEAVA